MNLNENLQYRFWLGLLYGVQAGSEQMLLFSRDAGWTTQEQALNMFIGLRTCNMNADQMFRIIKKWCDDNPTKTHISFEDIVFRAFLSLPIDKTCLE